MKTYNNVTIENASELNQSELMDAVKEQLTIDYPELSGEKLTIIADLMIRFDTDVIEDSDQFETI